MAAVSGAKTCHATLSTTVADAVTLTDPVCQVRVANHHASVITYVTVKSGNTAAGAADATTAVAAADETISIPPLTTKEVFYSSIPVYVSLSVVGSANAYSVEGSRSRFTE